METLTSGFGFAAAFLAVFFRFGGREPSSLTGRLSVLVFEVLSKRLDDIQGMITTGDENEWQVL
jgi:hypothetical protein